jgi:hypothetical protein
VFFLSNQESPLPSKQLAPQDVMRAPVSPSTSSVEEAALNYTPKPVVAAPGLWKSLKRGAKKVFSKSKPQASAPEEEAVVEEEAAEEGSSVLEAASESGISAPQELEESGAGDDEVLEPDVEFNNLTPGERLTALYTELGATDAFLTAVAADPDLVTAAVALGADTVVGFLAKETLTDGVVQQAATPLAGHMDALIAGLSIGSAMPAEVRAGLRRMLPGMTVPHAMAAFGARFNHGMVDNGGAWTMDNITQVWDQLDVLPDQDVSDLTVLTTFQAIAGGGGFGPSWEAPDTVNTIQLGEDAGANPAHMAHTVRHEVGHAVHAEIPGNINPWLEGDVKFWFYANDDTGVRQLVTELGGFPAKYTGPDGAEHDWDANADAWILNLLQTFIGGSGSWDPARPTVTDGQGDWETAMWDAMPDTVKDVATQSPSHWYANYNNFARGTKGSYFLNYWYARPFYMSDTAKAVVDATGDDYTAMSEKEFFANAYAEYFKDPAGYTDNTKWGGSLPGGVKDYFKKCIVDRQPYTAPDTGAEAVVDGTPTPPPGPSGMAGTP